MRRCRRPLESLASMGGLAVVALVARRADATEGAPLAFSFEGCPVELAAPTERIARIELHGRDGLPGAVTTIGVSCAPEGDAVRLTVDDPLTSKKVERSVSLADVPPEGRARLVALALAELVRASWLEIETVSTLALAASPPPTPDVTADVRARALAVATEPRGGRWFGNAAIEGLVVPSVGTPLLGLSLGARRDLDGAVGVAADLSGWDGSASRSTGAVTVRGLGLDGAVSYRLPIVELVGGLRVGWVGLTGAPSVSSLEGQTTSGFVFGPMVAASARIVGPVRVWLKTGWLLRGERGIVAGDQDVTVGGYWASLSVGLRVGS